METLQFAWDVALSGLLVAGPGALSEAWSTLVPWAGGCASADRKSARIVIENSNKADNANEEDGRGEEIFTGGGLNQITSVSNSLGNEILQGWAYYFKPEGWTPR